MDVIEMTRKLGQAIQEDERYKAYMEAFLSMIQMLRYRTK